MPVEYIPSCDPEDVLFERLDYLLEHYRGCKSLSCEECRRMGEIRVRLLRPFCDEYFPQQAIATKRASAHPVSHDCS